MLAVALLALLAIYCARALRVANDLSVFLPVSADDRAAELSRALALADPSRVLVFTVEAAAPDAARDAARVLARALAKRPELAWAEAGPAPDLVAEMERLLFARRYQLVDVRSLAPGASDLSDEALGLAAARLKDSLLTPLGPLVSRIAERDPLLVFLAVLERLRGLRIGELTVADGQYMTDDGRAAVVLSSTVAGVLDSERQSEAIAAIDDEIEGLRERLPQGVAVEYTGVGRFAVRSQDRMLADATRIGVVSTVAVLLVFIAILGSVRLLLASMAVVLAGLLSGLAAVLLAYGQIHALTLGIGMTLIGVCEDFPVHYFSHWLAGDDHELPRATMRRLWPALFLGAATTVVGFAALGLTSYAGLREVALFAAAGVTGALVVTWLLLPPLAMPRPSFDGGRMLVARLTASLGPKLTRPAARAAALIIVLAVALLGGPRVVLDRSLASLNQLDSSMLEADARVRARAGMSHFGSVVVAIGDDDETALRANDRVASRLAEYVARNEMKRPATLHAVLPSEESQRRSFDAVAADASVGARVLAAFQREGFRSDAFDPFLRELATLQFDALTLDDLRGTSLERVAAAFRVPVGDRVGVLTFVAPGTDTAVLREALIEYDDVVVFDQRQAIDEAYSGYQSELARVLWVGMAAVFLLTVAQYRGLARAIAVCLPSVLAIVFTICALSLCGVALNMMHLAALVLVFAMGVDYAIFFEQSSREASEGAATLASVAVASTTTILGFGLLAMSDIPALRSIGQTTGLGITTSAVLALILRPATHATDGTAAR